ncbi:MAG: NAD(P)-dependent alcohol dehydrogenase, partial [Syntrophobacteraceae bacterium]
LVGPVDHAVETTGVSRVIDQAMKSLGPSGKMSKLGVSHEEPHQGVTPQRPGPDQRVFYSIAGDSDPQEFIPYMIRCYREGKFPFDKLIKQYRAQEINRAVKESQDGHTVKAVLRF